MALRPGPVHAETSPGVSDTEIRIGQSCDLSGPVKGLGLAIRDAAQIYFDHINANGGIHGRTIRLITLDDGYQPETCRKNTEALIRDEQVLLLFGYVGTPTSQAALPLIRENKIPLFAPATGATMFRNPVIPEVFHIRSSYFQEIEAMVDHLVSDKKSRRIAVFHQNDAYGQDGLDGVHRATAKHGLSPVAAARYDRENPAVEKAAAELLKENPDAVILIGSSEPSARLISTMRTAGSDAIFMNVSFVNGELLASLLMNYGVGVVVSQVVPFPFYKRIPVVGEYNQLSAQLRPDIQPTFVGLEGFMAAKALCSILMASPEALSREGFIARAEKQGETDIGGFTYAFSPEQRQGNDLVYLTQIGPGGFLRPINNLSELYPFFRD